MTAPVDVRALGSDRVQVLDYPAAAPGKCVVCGSPGGDGRKFIDFGFTFERYGRVYFCSECMVTISNALGYASPEQRRALESQVGDLTKNLTVTRAREKAIRESLAILVGEPGHVLDDPSRVNDRTQFVPGDIQGSTGPDKGVAETPSQSRPNDVPDVAAKQYDFSFDE